MSRRGRPSVKLVIDDQVRGQLRYRVRADHGHLNIYPGDGDPVARLTPLGGGQYGLSFHRHTGQWERMPFAGDLAYMAETVVTTLGMHLERCDFPRGMSGSDH